jgi:hypothetical protein
MPEIQTYFIAYVVYKITFKLDPRGRGVHVHSMKAFKEGEEILVH